MRLTETNAPDVRKIPVNSIAIPPQFVAVATHWYDGSGDKLYAICSTGGLTTGTIRPRGCDSDEKWYCTIWRDLAVDVMRARVSAEALADSDDCDDYSEIMSHCRILRAFENWVDYTVDRLERSYGLSEWDGYDD